MFLNSNAPRSGVRVCVRVRVRRGYGCEAGVDDAFACARVNRCGEPNVAARVREWRLASDARERAQGVTDRPYIDRFRCAPRRMRMV